jgi:hypothetical protein
MKIQNNFRKVNFLIILLIIILFSSAANADLYLNSRTGFINLNTTGQTRLQITPGGNLNLLGQANISIPGNLSVGGNVSVDGSTLFVDSNDNRVGIGTTSPGNYYSARLVVAPSADEDGITIVAPATTDIGSYLMFADGTSGNARFRGYIQYDHNNDKMFLASAATQRMTIDSGGNVGIGTTAPAVTLDVAATNAYVRANGTSAASMIIDRGASTNGASLNFRTAGTENFIVGTGVYAAGTIFQIGDATSPFVTVDANGNVGIGTASPNASLQIKQSSDGTGNGLKITRSSEDTWGEFYISSSNQGQNDPITLVHHRQGVSPDTDLMVWGRDGTVIVPSGNVGIGTTSPSSLVGDSDPVLEVSGTRPAIVLNDTDAGASSWEIRGSSGLQIVENGTSTVFFIKDGGNVGIGTTGPASLTHISGSVPDITLTDTDTNIDSRLSANSGTGGVFIDLDINAETGGALFQVRDGITPRFAVQDDGLAYFTGDGNVGIGTATPSEILHINLSGAGGAGTGNTLKLSRINSGTAEADFIIQNIGGGTPWIGLKTGGKLGFATGLSNADTGDVRTDSLMMIDTNGNVGIGTVDPSYDLHVNGTDADIALTRTGGGTLFIQPGSGTADNTIRSSTNNGLDFWTNNIERVTIDATGNVGINDTSPDGTLAITINQGGADDGILHLKSSDIAHGMTTLAETDTFGLLQKDGADDGGVLLRGFSEGTRGIHILSDHTTDDTTKATNADAAINIDARLKSGTTSSTVGADANLAVITNAGTARFIFDAEGSFHADIESTTFDDHNDPVLLRAVRASRDPNIENEFRKLIEENRGKAEEIGLVAPDNDNGTGLVDVTKMMGLSADAIWQLYINKEEKEKVLDLAEEYDVLDATEPGTVLTVDSTKTNRLAVSTAPYQVVTGVISYHKPQLRRVTGDEYLPEDHPQLELHNFTNPQSVALTGIVPTKATNENGNIEIGDILVSSSKKGFAMKADDELKMTLNSRYNVGVALVQCYQNECVINIQR